MALFRAVQHGHTSAAAAIARLLHGVAKLARPAGPLEQQLQAAQEQLMPLFCPVPSQRSKGSQPHKGQKRGRAGQDAQPQEVHIPLLQLPPAAQVLPILQLSTACADDSGAQQWAVG